MQRGFAPISIVLIIAALVGGYLLYQNQTKPTLQPTAKLTSTPSPVPESTNSAEIVYTEASRSANWKTYTNTKYGFEIKHPVEAIIQDGMADPTVGGVWIIVPRQSDQDTGSQLKISVEDNPKSKSVKDFCLSQWDSKYSIIEERQIRIGDIIAHTVRLDTHFSPNISTTCIAKENKILVLDFDIDSIKNDPLVKKHTQTLNLIISTFKFLP